MEEGKEIRGGIRHSGVVIAVNGDKAVVSIIAGSACASCHVKNACSASDTKEKIIEAVIPQGVSVSAGDNVEVIISQNNGYIAVFVSYLVPVIILLASIIIATKIGYSEAAGGVFGLCAMAFYFVVLYLLRKKIDKKLVIEVVPKN